MNRLEKSIFMDLRTLYFSNATANNGKIDATDMELLHYRLACHTEQEQQALARLLKDQFKKIGKTYRNSDWDNQIKNIIWAMKNGKYGITDSITQSVTDSVTQNQKGVTDGRHTADENVTKSVTQNQANIITINQTHNQEREQKSEKPQNLTAHTQRNLNSITHWQAPTLDEIRSILLANDFAGVFTQEIYDQILPKFKNHFENLEITENKRLATEQSRIDRLVAWIKRERQIANLSDNTTPAKKLDPSKTVMLNGLAFEPLPNMTVQQTYQFVQKHKLAYEMSDEAYKRIKQEINWQQFDYQTFLNDFNQQQAVA